MVICAPKSANRDVDCHRASLPRQVAEHAAINAVDPLRGRPTARTFRHGRTRHSFYCDLLGCREHACQSERLRDEGKQGRGHGLSTTDVSPGLSISSSPTSPSQHAECGRISFTPASTARAVTGHNTLHASVSPRNCTRKGCNDGSARARAMLLQTALLPNALRHLARQRASSDCFAG